VGISANVLPPEDRQFYKNKGLFYGEESMVRAVERAGGVAVYLPVPAEPEAVDDLVDVVDAIILSGGTDVDPSTYGEELLDERWRGQPDRDAFEGALLRRALGTGRRVLGICRGCQVINASLGGTLWQDVSSLRPGTRSHRDQEAYDAFCHRVEVLEGTPLAALIGSGERQVNSVHHQAVKDLAPGMEVWASAGDGVIEAVGDPNEPNLMAVQWHPEWMPDDAGARALFAWLVDR
jgi:putative glutamine amidotransferase